MDKNLNFLKLIVARSKRFFEQSVMILLHDILHFEGYWSIFQSLICELKPIFDACQMIIFSSLLFGGQRPFGGQKMVRLKNGCNLIERYLDNLNFIKKRFPLRSTITPKKVIIYRANKYESPCSKL